MATILLSAAGAAIGGAFGGTVLGLSGAVIGRAVGATLGRVIDQQLLGGGSGTVETGRVDRLRLTTASEGEGLGRIWGRMRMAGQVIWATQFFEAKKKSGGGKGEPSIVSYSYSVSLAVALGEGEILRVGRVWADGVELDTRDLNMRVYSGSETQEPDPKIAAVEGMEKAPSYRGIAYVVFENLELSPFGNRVPHFTFEVVRAAQGEGLPSEPDLSQTIEAVALIPGTGEYSLATRPVSEQRIRSTPLEYPATSSLFFFNGWGITAEVNPVNQHSPSGQTDFEMSLGMLDEELPNCGTVSLVVSWFGNDLRCGNCKVQPKVASKSVEGREMSWRVSGVGRGSVDAVPKLDDRSVYGGTPADAAVIDAIKALHDAGKAVTFSPFILMDQLEGNGLHDPWSDGAEQPALPWRGRITTSAAPENPGSPDGTSHAADEVATFFGTAAMGDFAPTGETVTYSGPAEWSFRRFVLHYAHLCKLAGGVEAFCIGSEMRALTQIRGMNNSFPAVEALRVLAGEVRQILGPDCKIGYAADWTEYFGYHPGNGDCFFHLDPLWADDAIDFIGIDNYMPLSDWRDGENHADAHWGAIYNLDYLRSNIEGGEGYDWYYASAQHRDAQIRTPIIDGAHDEPWLWRYKDIRGWWDHDHHDRINGERLEEPTAWVPRSKPIWFTELGCAAIDKGTNEPNKFLDPKSSESALPHYSDGRRDDTIQMQYLRAMTSYWADLVVNPVSDIYGGPMVDMSRAHVWAWDARPYPQFPGLDDVWSDARNYARGHWLSGRSSAQPLVNVVAEICEMAGVRDIDVSALYGVVRGFAMQGGITPRGALQSLSIIYGFDALERDGLLVFRMRDASVDAQLWPPQLALDDQDVSLETQRAPEAEIAGRVRLSYVEADGCFEVRAVESIFPDEEDGPTAASEVPLAMTRSEGMRVVDRWLSEARVAQDRARFTLPPSLGWLGPGDVVNLEKDTSTDRYRIDRIERAETIQVEAVRVEPGIYEPAEEEEEGARLAPYVPPVPVTPVFLDLPLMTGAEDPYAPHLAVAASPWPGAVAVYSGLQDAGYELNSKFGTQAVIGTTLSPLRMARSGLWDRGEPLRVELISGEFETALEAGVLSGLNALAIGDGSSDNWEILQFQRAEPVEPGIWDLSLRLRGQLGTDALMPAVWPEGSVVVLLDGQAQQIALAPAARNMARHYRIGSAARPYDDPSYIHTVQAFAGNGLRPLSPCHLRVVQKADGWKLSWVRRTRIGGDDWEAMDVPLGEVAERYLLRILEGEAIRREVVLTNSEWTYSTAQKAVDGIAGAFWVEVAQLSDVFGPGLTERVQVLA